MLIFLDSRLPKDSMNGSSGQVKSTQSQVWSQNSSESRLIPYEKFMSKAIKLSLIRITKLPTYV